MLKISSNVKIENPEGKVVTVQIYTYTRGGTKSPDSDFIFYKNRLISPFEQRIRGWKWTLKALFMIVYGDMIDQMIPNYNTFLSMIPKDTEKGSVYPPVKIY